MDYLARLQIERARLWGRVYADAMNGGYLNERINRSVIATEIADKAVEDFDTRFPKAGAAA